MQAIVVGVVLALIGVGLSHDHLKQFAYSWLLAFWFAFSFGVGGWFMVIIHHLVDASWSVPVRRITEGLSSLLGPTLAVLFLPIAFLAPTIYPWMQQLQHPNHALTSKYPLFTMPGFYLVSFGMFLLWWFLTSRLRYWSFRQDESGSAECTRKNRFYSSIGIVFFAITVTLAAVLWVKGLMDEWYSTMYAVTYFAAAVWMTWPTVYMIALVLERAKILDGIVKEKTYYFIGSLFFAFTVFWAYVNFDQYFIIWNANMPEENFWFVLREKGSWDWIGKYIIIFGHFFLPFLMLLRIDFKLKLPIMAGLCGWAWLMHFVDMEFQIMPALHPDGAISAGLISDIGCTLVCVGILAIVFIKTFSSHPPYPQKDPRMAEALEVYVPPHSDISTAPERAK